MFMQTSDTDIGMCHRPTYHIDISAKHGISRSNYVYYHSVISKGYIQCFNICKREYF